MRESPSEPANPLGNSEAATIEEIRASLDSETMLVEYFCIEDRVWAAVLSTTTLEFAQLGLASALRDKLRRLQFQMSKFRLGREYVTTFEVPLLRAAQDNLQTLYEDVFRPLGQLVKGRNLIIVPFGPLHSLPFHALFDGQQFLIDNFTISYAPSASIYALCRRERPARTGSSLILGVEDPKTPFIRQEIEAVAAAVSDPEILLGPDATERALRQKGCHSRLVHIATHGYFRVDNPMFSAIRLADSHLSLYDLYYMNLPVELLTLSGCVTGLNVIAEGDEMLGLARGLLYAGARSLLLSLWDVDDRCTAEFMRLFYSQLFQKHNQAEALRSAMLELRKQHPHPYYWAPIQTRRERSSRHMNPPNISAQRYFSRSGLLFEIGARKMAGRRVKYSIEVKEKG